MDTNIMTLGECLAGFAAEAFHAARATCSAISRPRRARVRYQVEYGTGSDLPADVSLREGRPAAADLL